MLRSFPRILMVTTIATAAACGGGDAGPKTSLAKGPSADSARQIEEFRAALIAEPHRYIAQPTLALSTVPTCVAAGVAPRHVDLRPFVLVGEDITVNLRTVKAIPLRIPVEAKGPRPPANLVVRGEAFIPVKDFEELDSRYTSTNVNPGSESGWLSALCG